MRVQTGPNPRNPENSRKLFHGRTLSCAMGVQADPNHEHRKIHEKCSIVRPGFVSWGSRHKPKFIRYLGPEWVQITVKFVGGSATTHVHRQMQSYYLPTRVLNLFGCMSINCVNRGYESLLSGESQNRGFGFYSYVGPKSLNRGIGFYSYAGPKSLNRATILSLFVENTRRPAGNPP